MKFIKPSTIIAFVCFVVVVVLSIVRLSNNDIMLRDTFRFHARTDLDSFDPVSSANTVSSYIYNAMQGPLLKYQKHELQGAGAKKCEALSALQYVCELRKDWGWSDGPPVTASHVLNGYNALVQAHSPRLENFLNVRQVKVLGEANKPGGRIEFTLYKPDADFLYRLIDPALSPRRVDIDAKAGTVTAGPYSLKERKPGRSFLLKPNTHYSVTPPTALIEVMIVDDDATALRLYETRQLNFLRRLTADRVNEYSNGPDFMRVPMMRFDYIGFGPAVAVNENLRRQLIYSLFTQYQEFAQLMHSLGPPGCFGLIDVLPHGQNLFDHDFCYGSPEADSKMSLAKTKFKPFSAQEIKKLPKLSLNYSTWGDDDVRRGMELFQHGWKKNLNLDIEMMSEEQGVLTEKLKRSPPPLFRRGVSLERPTCLAALETFESTNPNNFIRYHDRHYDQLLSDMRAAHVPEKYNSLCRQGLRILFEARRMIPMGAIHYAMLNDQKFDGFYVNELNQLDVGALAVKSPR